MPAVVGKGQPNEQNGNKLRGNSTLSHQSNGGQHRESLQFSGFTNKKMQLMQEEIKQNGSSYKTPNVQTSGETQTCKSEDVFLDTFEGDVHMNDKQNRRPVAGKSKIADDEPMVVFGHQSNTSIAQTAKDQFATALLRLQSGLDQSCKRLDAIETKLKQVEQKSRNQAIHNQRNTSGWLKKENISTTLFHIGWPVLVYFAMRAIEQRRQSIKSAV